MSTQVAWMFGLRCLLTALALLASVCCVMTKNYTAAGWFGFVAICFCPSMPS